MRLKILIIIIKMHMDKMKLLLFASLILITSIERETFAQCSANNCTPLSETFGTPAGGTCGGAQTITNTSIVNHCNNNVDCGGPGAIGDGEYVLACNGDGFNANWHGGNSSYIQDKTVGAGQTGLFALINANGGPLEFYHTTVTEMCPGSTYKLSFYAANVTKGTSGVCAYGGRVNLSAYTFPSSGTGSTVQTGAFSSTNATRTLTIENTGTTNTGDIGCTTGATSPGGLVWTEYTSTFTAATGENSLNLVLVSNLDGNTAGTDFVIDDVTITYQSGAPAGFTCTTPVELTSFTAEKLSTKALLKWSTASEKNFSYFSIEKSEDGTNFIEIGAVNGRGNSSDMSTYEFEDRQFNSNSYYRLKMTDADGSYKYSSLSFLSKDEYARIINRSGENQLEIKAVVGESTQWNLAVYSLMGQEYFNEKVSLVKGENTILKQISGGEQSAKIVRITSLDGSVILSEVIVW
jgi:hypothetical protein